MIALSNTARERHLYVIGKTRSGKTTLLLNLIRQDIESGKGVCFIDPHGDAAELALQFVPKNRVKDTYYLEPTEYPLGVSPAVETSEVDRVVDDLLITFRRLDPGWGPRMDALFRYSFYSTLHVRGSLLDVHRLLADKGYQASVIDRLDEGALKTFWTQEYPTWARDSAVPILNRMVKFVLSAPLSACLSSSVLRMEQVMANEGVAIVNLGKVGQDTASILGTLLISQVQLAAMKRVNIPYGRRVPFYLYVDEFQNFVGTGFDKILSEAGKFKLSLTLAHQFLGQLDQRMRDTIVGNIGTMMIFRVGDDDRRYFKLGANPPQHHAYIRTEAGWGMRPLRMFPLPEKARHYADDIKARMHALKPSVRVERLAVGLKPSRPPGSSES